MDGLLLVDKSSGKSSFDVIRRLRPVIGVRKIGYAGTLDPIASGLLLLGIGKGTKALTQISDLTKTYVAEIALGVATTTDDTEGEVLSTASPERLAALERKDIEDVLPRFEGEIQQTPPRFSAKHVKGQRAYKLARKGEEVELEPCDVIVHKIELESVDLPRFRVRVECGKGFYVRALARDIGEALEVGGHLAALRRVAIGSFRVEDAVKDTEFERELILRKLLPLPAKGK